MKKTLSYYILIISALLSPILLKAQFRATSFEELILTDTNLYSEKKSQLEKEIYNENNSDSIRIENYMKLADLYALNFMADKALAIFDTIRYENNDLSLDHYTHILERKADIFEKAKKYDIAIQAKLEVLKKYEHYSKTNLVVTSYLDIVDLFVLSNDLNNAFYYLSIANKLAEQEKLVNLQAKCYYLFGNLYKKNGELSQAEEYYLRAIELAQGCNCETTLALIYNNTGTLYRIKDDLFKAKEYIQKAIDLNLSAGNFKLLLINYNNLGNIYQNLGFYQPAIDYYEKSIQLVDSLNIQSENLGGYSNIFKIYASNHNYEKAYQYYTTFTELKDSLSELESQQTSLRLAAQFQSNRKEAEIERFKIQERLREEELNSEKNSKRVLVLFISIILVITVSLWVSSLQRKKINKDLTLKNERIDEQHKEIIDSINYAKRIQNSILPSTQLLNNTLPNNALLYLPKDIVSGDFYICEKIGNYVYFGVADCTGHGVPGAMVSLVASSVLNKCLHELKLTDTNDILDHLNIEVPQVLASDNEEIHDGMDIALCRLDVNTLQLQFSGAYLNCWVFNETSSFLNRIPTEMNFSGKNGLNILEIKGNRKGIGKSNVSSKFKVVEFQLQKGDKIMLSSDGFEDQFGGPKNKKFKLNQMRNLVFAYGAKSVDVLLQELSTSFQTWKGSNEQVDDVCLMIIEI